MQSSPFAAICLASLAAPAMADITFTTADENQFAAWPLGPGTNQGEVREGAFARTTKPTSVTLELSKLAWAEADSFDLEVASLGLDMNPTKILTQGDGLALLSWTMDVGGTFSGEGDDAFALTEIHSVIRNVASHTFEDKKFVDDDGDFNQAWNTPLVLGSKVVGPGMDVTPYFDIDTDPVDGWKTLYAYADGIAEMRNQWVSGTITMTLTPVPTPGSLAIVALGSVAILRRRRSSAA